MQANSCCKKSTSMASMMMGVSEYSTRLDAQDDEGRSFKPMRDDMPM